MSCVEPGQTAACKFKELVKRQVENQLFDKWASEPVILTSKTESYDDTTGHLTSISDSTSNTTAILQEVTEKDRLVLDLGYAQIGDTVAYFKISDTVNEKDEVQSRRTGKKYQVTKIRDMGKIAGFELFQLVNLNFRGEADD